MKKINEADKARLIELFTSYPLYKKVEVAISSLRNGTDIVDLTFSYYCPNEKNNQTFKLNLETEKVIDFAQRLEISTYNALFESYDSQSGYCHLTQHYSATCQYCKAFKVHFLLQLDSSGKLPLSNFEDAPEPKQIVEKIGQYPPYEIDIDRDMQNFLNEEDKGNYKKALICLSQNYGIGAFAYLRRIVENEILGIIERIGSLDRPESKSIQELLAEHKSNHNMASLIDGIYDFLPSSLKSLGSNPLKFLYSQLSEGIHLYSEEECSDEARNIETVLKFVIRKIREETSEVRSVREALNKLK